MTWTLKPLNAWQTNSTVDAVNTRPARATCTAEVFQGLPCHRLSLPTGDSALIAEHGAQVLSWRSAGRERLYLSPRSRFDGQSAIRGGVPVCWPQFNQRGSLPKHGFARNLPWLAGEPALGPGQASLSLRLATSPATQVHWPEAFELTLNVLLSPGSLRLELSARNTGDQAWAFSGALHTYLAVDDLAQTSLHGLTGRQEWDAVTDHHGVASPVSRFTTEFDRVYGGTAMPMRLQDGGAGLRITQSTSWANTVVWNPGAAKCAELTDMPPNGYQHMLCVEAAQVDEPVSVEPKGQWQGWQQFDIA